MKEDDPRYAASDPVAPEQLSMEKVPPGDDAITPTPPVADEPVPGDWNEDGHTLKDKEAESHDYEVRCLTFHSIADFWKKCGITDCIFFLSLYIAAVQVW